ncbi:PaaX family transcriptional regulator C-terminal domain-containing protein [Sphaerisporangium fuscum]|uniref:PaaX family transcriptional regulator C-terminal domain-containing protein n=1 Tax=Sphaerisporangium fuscum TaxID=2835868 RepID=UPI001BDC6EB9|nr:PaaX family transcriptional regulator C-terminal domain-containing protein [Sphaerisporangium fuscum]
MNENVASGGAVARPSRGRSVALVPFLFGAAGRTELSGTALTRLLQDLDLTEAAARALLARMRREGHLTSERRGGGAYYRLAGDMAAGFARIRQGGSAEPAQWAGHFHALLYHVPETERAYRDALRRAALLTGYGLLQQGVLIALTDRSAQLGPLLSPPEGVRLRKVTIAMPEEDAARAAYEAWDLGSLSEEYARHAEAIEAALRRAPEAPPADAAALRAFSRLLGTAMVDTLRAPRLPEPLRPADWALPRLHAAIGAVHRVYGRPAVTYVRRVLDEG